MIDEQIGQLQSSNVLLNDVLQENAQGYSESAFNLVLSIAETVILPIAGVIFAYIIINELIQLQVAQNNMHENVVLDLYKWMFKTMLGILLISNSFTIANALIEVGAEIIGQVIPLVSSEMAEVELATPSDLMDLKLGRLLSIWISLLIQNVIGFVSGFVVQLFIVTRFFEIYMYLMMAPVPFATLTSDKLSQTGLNYIKNVIALAIQGLIILVSFSLYVAISATLLVEGMSIVDGIGTGGNPLFESLVLVVVLTVMVLRSKSIAQSIVGAG